MSDNANEILSGQYEESQSSSDTWMMTFADLLSLLLVFFIMIYSMSSVRQGEWEKVVESLGDSFKSSKLVEEGAYSTYLGVTKVDIRRGMDLDYLNAVLESRVNEDPFLSGNIKINNDEESLIVTLKSKNLFEGNTPVLNEDSRLLLFVIGESLQRVSNQIEVVGYTRKKGRNDSMEEWELTLSRAIEVAAALREYGNLSRLESLVEIKKLKSKEEGATNAVDIIIRRYTKEY